uniref:Uncharacterized protein n=1 Tax=Anguilla anguilla TaxID=7936 RepID=A0A0E9S1F0_ANGAN
MYRVLSIIWWLPCSIFQKPKTVTKKEEKNYNTSGKSNLPSVEVGMIMF